MNFVDDFSLDKATRLSDIRHYLKNLEQGGIPNNTEYIAQLIEEFGFHCDSESILPFFVNFAREFSNVTVQIFLKYPLSPPFCHYILFI